MAEHSEFRRDIISGDWVLIAPGRSKRPEVTSKEPFPQAQKECPFDDPQATGHGEPVLAYAHGKRIESGGNLSDWTVQIIPNKFPALTPNGGQEPFTSGLFQTCGAFGRHELLITRNHEKSFAEFSLPEIEEIIVAYRERYRQIAQEPYTKFILIFNNHGRTAGASIAHNHSQIISLPIFPPEVIESITGAEKYFREYGKKAHDLMIQWEIKQKTRVVFENDAFIVFCPFVSRTPYEMRLFPKESVPYFELLSDRDVPALAEALSVVLRAVKTALNDSDYNFYIHTAPVTHDPAQRLDYDFYHWHVEIVPRLKIDAGFELGIAIAINPVDPDDAAAHLREQVEV
jgi:UDPglucose--hexose-1-phosphate uridylyltransferase